MEDTPRAGGEPDAEWKLYPQDEYQVASDPTLPPVSLWPATDVGKRTRSFYAKGMRSTAVAVILTHRWLVPHFLVLIRRRKETGGSSAGKPQLDCGFLSCKYPPTQSAVSALEARLRLYFHHQADDDDEESQLCVSRHLGTLWVTGPNDYSHPQPLIPAHVTRPRERVRLYQVCLPPNGTFTVPTDYTLKSIPLSDASCHIPLLPYAIQQLPFILSRFVFTYFAEGQDDELLARTFHTNNSTARPSTARTPASGRRAAADTEQAQLSQIDAIAKSLASEDTIDKD